MFHVKHLPHDLAAIDNQSLAGNKRGGGRGQEKRRGDNIVGCSPAFHRYLLCDFFAKHLRTPLLPSVFNPARCDAVHTHKWRKRTSQAVTHSDHGPFAGGVQLADRSWRSIEGVVPTDIENTAALAHVISHGLAAIPSSHHIDRHDPLKPGLFT